MDPDHDPPEAALHMEYLTFYQAWRPHLETRRIKLAEWNPPMIALPQKRTSKCR
jgi:hypothetical protein